jgi:hypothetical protein
LWPDAGISGVVGQKVSRDEDGNGKYHASGPQMAAEQIPCTDPAGCSPEISKTLAPPIERYSMII